MKREKYIKVAAEGEGKCPGEWSPKRLEYKECSLHRCKTAQDSAPLACNTTLDVILLIDGSGSLGQAGWNAEIKAAKAFVGAFKTASEGYIEMAVILFSGPRTWSGVYRCTGKQPSSSASLQECGITQVTHYTDDLNSVDQKITALSWPQGSTLTSLALLTAKAEMTLGRSDTHTVVVVFTDGRPLSYRKTYEASRQVRKVARLMWVPITRYAPLSQIKQWATRRWQENVVVVKHFDDLEKPLVITHIIADMCPKEPPKSQFERR
jgi:Mg-chelatase subunit ChlD